MMQMIVVGAGNTLQSLISQGIELAIYGMGTVFLFLGLLTLATVFMSTCLLRFMPAPKRPLSTGKHATQSSPPDATRLIAIISAAIAQHRSAKK